MIIGNNYGAQTLVIANDVLANRSPPCNILFEVLLELDVSLRQQRLQNSVDPEPIEPWK